VLEYKLESGNQKKKYRYIDAIKTSISTRQVGIGTPLISILKKIANSHIVISEIKANNTFSENAILHYTKNLITFYIVLIVDTIMIL